MNKRITEAFANGKAFIPFLTCGDPSLEVTEQLVYAMEEAGADLIELGIPFSDPTAEGPVIQEANVRALSGGVTTDKIFDMVRAVTERNQRRALDLYNDLLTLREPPMRILFLLSKQFRQMCLAKKRAGEGASQNEIATRLGVPSFVARNILACARAYSVEELEQAEEDFVDAEEAVKTGRLQDVLSVELLIVKYSTERKR